MNIRIGRSGRQVGMACEERLNARSQNLESEKGSNEMPKDQPSLFEFSNGTHMRKIEPIELSDTEHEFIKVTREVDSAITRSVLPDGFDELSTTCPVLGKDHHAVKLPGDVTYWCSGCGKTGLQPPDKKSWE